MLSDIFAKLSQQAAAAEARIAGWKKSADTKVDEAKAQINEWKESADAEHQKNLDSIKASMDKASDKTKSYWNEMKEKSDAKIAEIKAKHEKHKIENAKREALDEADWAEAAASDAVYNASAALDEAESAIAYAVEKRIAAINAM